MDLQKIAKVLALAASDNEAEALHALRTARRLLAESGSDFVALADQWGGGEGAGRAALENAVFDLRNEVRQLRCENERLKQARNADGAPTSMFEAARAAGDVIRLRAELAEMHEILVDERATQAALRVTLQEMQAELAVAIGKLSDAEVRRMRLEAENRRLSHANHALTVELDDARVVKAVPVELIDPEPRAERKPRGGARTAKKPLSQYALF